MVDTENAENILQGLWQQAESSALRILFLPTQLVSELNCATGKVMGFEQRACEQDQPGSFLLEPMRFN